MENKLNISDSVLNFPEYKLAMITSGGERVVGKMNTDKDGNIDSSMMYETVNIVTTMMMSEKGLMQFLTTNENGNVMYIPEDAIITVLSRASQYFKEYVRVTSNIVEAPKNIIKLK
jgi:hypothetical protein